MNDLTVPIAYPYKYRKTENDPPGGGQLRKDPANRILLGINKATFAESFHHVDTDSFEWHSKWLPKEDAKSRFQTLNWQSTASPLIILAGQHRKLPLEEHIKEQNMSLEEASWVANIYDLDSLPHSLMINMGGNALSIQRGASPSEVFRDMAAVAKCPARTDTTIVRPTLTGEREGQDPTLEKFLKFNKQGQKTAVTQNFKETLQICAANSESLPKFVAILASPLATSLTTWVKF